MTFRETNTQMKSGATSWSYLLLILFLLWYGALQADTLTLFPGLHQLAHSSSKICICKAHLGVTALVYHMEAPRLYNFVPF